MTCKENSNFRDIQNHSTDINFDSDNFNTLLQ